MFGEWQFVNYIRCLGGKISLISDIWVKKENEGVVREEDSKQKEE